MTYLDTPSDKPDLRATPTFEPLRWLPAGPARTGVLIVSAVAACALLLRNISTSLQMMWVGYSPVPYGDQWDACLFPDHFLQTLFAQHNEHRPALCRLIGLFDWYFGDARNAIELSFIALCYPLFAVALFKLLNMIVADWRRALIYTALASSIVVSAEQYENLLWGFQTAFVGSFIFAFAALLFAVLAAQSPRSAIAVFLCFTCSFLSVFSLASGLLTPIFVTILLFAIGAPSKLKYGYIVFAVAIFAFYFHGYVRPSYHSNPLVSLEQIWPSIHYLFAYIGSPFAAGDADVATAVGEFGVLLLLFPVGGCVVGLLKDRKLLRTDAGAAFAALVLFAVLIVCAGILTALGRLDFGIAQAMASRYGTPALLFWGDLIAIYLAQPFVRASEQSRLVHWGGAVLGIVLALYVAAHQRGYMPQAAFTRAYRIKGAIAYLIGIRNQPAVVALYPNAQALANGYLHARFERLVRQHKSIFSDDWADRLGTPLLAWKGAPQAGCRGFIDRRTAVPDQAKPISELSGWAWDDVRKQVPDLIVFTTGQDLVVGFGAPGYPREEVQRIEAGITSTDTGWDGFARADMSVPLRAYGVFFDAPNRACEFAQSPQHQ